MKPWREIAHPHKDVREGSLQQSEFAADISAVVQGIASLVKRFWNQLPQI